MSGKLRRWVWLVALGGCAEPRRILFTELTDDRVPRVEQTTFRDRNEFFGPGAAVGDVDGDQRIDVYLAGDGLYLNRPDARGFRFEAAQGRLPPLDLEPLGAAFGDFDRDGDLDLALCGQGGARLLENDGTGSFTDVTARAGIAGPPTDLNVSVAFGDIDGDGWLDLSVSSYGIRYDADQDAQASHLYLNRRDRTFEEHRGLFAQPLSERRAIVTAFADFDNDGRLDLYLGDDRDVAFLTLRQRHDDVFLNRGWDAAGGLTLVESSATLGLHIPHSTMGLSFGDSMHGPGWDVFVTDIGAGWLYRSAGAGARFDDVTRGSGIDLSSPPLEQWVMWGAPFADLDGDGSEDLLVTQAPIHPGMPGTAMLGPVLYRGLGGTFELTRYAFGAPMSTRAVVLADFDGDGDDDVIAVPFWDRMRFFVNDTAPRRFLRVQLDASVSAPGAAGAVVELHSGGATQKRMRVAGGQPSSEGEQVIDFALGDGGDPDLVVLWPSGARQVLPSVATGARVNVSEPRWITLGDPRPAADGTTRVAVSVDVGLAGLGGPGSHVTLAGPGLALQADCDAAGVAHLELPARSSPGPLRITLQIDGREMPAHPALDYH